MSPSKQSFTKESLAGIFVLIGLICVAYMTIKLGRLELFSESGFPVKAAFTSASGLRTGADVEIAGVKIGRVTGITLDKENPMAIVSMSLDEGLEITDDVVASIKTSGLIGDKYISLEQGAGDPLEPNDIIFDTESPVDIESLISKYVFGGVQSDE